MTDRMKALDALIEAVEAGSLKTVSAADIYHALGRHLQKRFWEAWHGSLDACLALHEALLPEWGWDLASDGYAYVFMVGNSQEHHRGSDVCEGPITAARSWLIAILKAYREAQK